MKPYIFSLLSPRLRARRRSGSRLQQSAFPPGRRPVPSAPADSPGGDSLPKTLKEAREQLERKMIRDALLRHHGRISDASRELGVSRATCIELARKFGIAVT